MHTAQQQALAAVNAPIQAVTGRPLIGNGANGAPASTNPLHTAQQQALAAVNAPIQAVTGRPLIGNGANGAPGPMRRAAVTFDGLGSKRGNSGSNTLGTRLSTEDWPLMAVVRCGVRR